MRLYYSIKVFQSLFQWYVLWYAWCCVIAPVSFLQLSEERDKGLINDTKTFWFSTNCRGRLTHRVEQRCGVSAELRVTGLHCKGSHCWQYFRKKIFDWGVNIEVIDVGTGFNISAWTEARLRSSHVDTKLKSLSGARKFKHAQTQTNLDNCIKTVFALVQGNKVWCLHIYIL